MSVYIPPECEQFIKSCTTHEVYWNYFIFGMITALIIASPAIYIILKEICNKNYKKTMESAE